MSKTNLWKKSNVHDSHELQKSWNNPTFSDSDDYGEGFPIVVNKEGKFYKKLYAFIESKATYINLILRLKCEDEKENSAPKGKYLKANKKSLQEEKEDRENALNLIREIVKSKFPKRSDEQIDLYLKELTKDPPRENCSLHDTLFQRNEKKMFVKHNLISYILNFVDCKTLIKFKECSKIDNEMVSLYLRKILYTLSFKDNEIKTNIHYWRNVVDYFFFKSGNLKPIERSKYPMIANELEKNKSFCTITKDSMDSNIFISLDYFNENLISSCNHNNPLPHTCNSKNKINGITHFKTDKITIVDFIEEYYKRLTINDDELMWNVCNFRKSPEFLTLLLFEYLKCMLSVLNKYSGICLFKKTEYMVNCGHHISHRIWIQMFYEYGHDSANMEKKKKKIKQNIHNTDNAGDHENDDNNNRTLYLTIADHYKWDA
ncbi:conserved Plasmodium protein, unknown function [Plasmodium ovale]|uniref:Uncharacterized protein n=1 Tax=Plasmodium ovale TaxID=36330 RepID=A0A1D3TG77_PLAOA|nr:conserved Plasmodium protein, unknown function [Plasmodium ovale]